MITAVDTNVLLDIFCDDPRHASASLRAAREASSEGSLVICEVVFAELSQPFSGLEKLRATLRALDVRVEPVGEEACFLAGRSFRQYRERGGKRDRMLADFLVGAHAVTRCARLLTRDRGYYRGYFPGLSVIGPA